MDYKSIENVHELEMSCEDLSNRLFKSISSLIDFKERYEWDRERLGLPHVEIDISHYEGILKSIHAAEMTFNKLRFDLMKKENLCGKCGCESS